MFWQLSTARTEVLDDSRQRRYCRIIFGGCCSQPPPHRPLWSTFGSAVSDHGSFPFLKPFPGCPSVRRHVRELGNRVGLRFGLRPGADPTVHHTSSHHAATAMRLSEVDASGDALSAPITVNINSIDARDGQAYHGRKTIATNGTRPAVAGSRAGEEYRTGQQRRRCFAPCVCSGAGPPGRT